MRNHRHTSTAQNTGDLDELDGDLGRLHFDGCGRGTSVKENLRSWGVVVAWVDEVSLGGGMAVL